MVLVLLHYIDGIVATFLLQDDCKTRKNTKNTVNLETFARVLLSRNFANAKFSENKNLGKCQNQSVVH